MCECPGTSWLPSQSPEWKTAEYGAIDRASPRRGAGRGSSRDVKEMGRTTSRQPPADAEVVIDSELFSRWNPRGRPGLQILDTVALRTQFRALNSPAIGPSTSSRM